MKNVTIYTKGYCPFCHGAKKILDSKGIEYTEFDVQFDDEKRAEMIQRSQRLTVPQIFFDNVHIGGHADLVAYYNGQRAA